MKKYFLSVLMGLGILLGCSQPSEATQLTESDLYGQDELELEVQEIEKTVKVHELTIVEYINTYFEKPVGILDVEEAAMIGASYIWDVLGINIDGKVLDISYTHPPGLNRSYWHALIAENKEDFERGQFVLSFMIDAFTGERVDIANSFDIDQREWGYAGWEFPNSQEVETYMEIAKTYVRDHFEFTEVIGIEPHPDFLFSAGGTLTFRAIDEKERVAEIMVQMGSGRLMFIRTQNNDWVG